MLTTNPTGSPTTPNLDHEDPENMTAVNKTQSEKIKRLQLMARVQALISDEVKGQRVIKQMEELKVQKKEEMLRGRDFLMANVEKAAVWTEVQG
jgi:hypothetical protein